MLAGDMLLLSPDGDVQRRHVAEIAAALRPRRALLLRLDGLRPASGAASLYRLAPDGTVHVVLEGVTVSNGLEWSPDGTLAYYNDTATAPGATGVPVREFAG